MANIENVIKPVFHLRARFEESKRELESLLTDEQLSNCPVLILGNKIDRCVQSLKIMASSLMKLISKLNKTHSHTAAHRPGAAGEDELRQFFGLDGQTTGKGTVSRYWVLLSLGVYLQI